MLQLKKFCIPEISHYLIRYFDTEPHYSQLKPTGMRKISYRSPMGIILSCLLFIATSCTNEEDKGTTSETPAATTSTPVEEKKDPSAKLIGGTLDTLWIASTGWPAQGEKIVFSFTIDQYDELKLHGWKVKNGPNLFDPNPNYRLANAGQHKGGTYGPDMYLGNIVLQANEVNLIRNKINQGGYTKVLFVPKVLPGNHIAYDIFVGKDDTGLAIMAVDPTGFEANPSPPKNYN